MTSFLYYLPLGSDIKLNKYTLNDTTLCQAAELEWFPGGRSIVERALTNLICNEQDEEALAAVQAFNPHDLYSKSDDPVDLQVLKPYYLGLIAKFFPEKLNW